MFFPDFIARFRICRAEPAISRIYPYFCIQKKRKMQYIDIHTHAAVPQARENCISFYNKIIGQDPPGGLSLVEPSSAGIHPWFIRPDETDGSLLGQLQEIAGRPEVRMIGEAGLDKRRGARPERQLYLFKQQALLAEELRKPLVIHCVKAWDELLALRKKLRPLSPWLVHGFRGKRESAGQLLKENILLSFGGQFQPAALQAAWPDRLFLETDDSGLDIREIYERAAAALSVPAEALAEQIRKNLSLLLGGRYPIASARTGN